MKVIIHTVDQTTGIETFDREGELEDLMKYEVELMVDVAFQLGRDGKAVVGGGAAQLFYIRPA